MLSLAALTGGQFVAAAGVPVVERTATGSTEQSTAAPTARSSAAPAAAVPTPAPAAPASRNPAAELLLMVDQLQEEVRFLRGRVEEQENLIRRMREDQRDRYRDLDRRLSLLSEQTRTVAPAIDVSKLPAAIPPLATSMAVTPSARAVSPAVSDTDAYKAAFSLVRQREFAAALEAFDQFLVSYPSSPLTPNVLYWSGEVHRAKPKPDMAAAEQAYATMVQRFPQHGKAADAYYKLGLTYADLGDKGKAKQMMETVVGRYPDQASAQLARDYLTRH